MNNFHIDNTTYAPYCSQCRDNGFDFSKDFADMCEACQDVRDSVKNVILPFRIICLTMLNKIIKVVLMKLSKGLDKGNPLNLEGNYLLTNKEGVNHEHRKFTRIQL